MATKQARGTKRTCQSEDCGSRFYDLNRDPITCPICGEHYEIASAPEGYVPQQEDRSARRARPKPEPVVEAEADGELPPVEGVESLEDVEESDADSAEQDETFLPVEEEEGGDVTTIIGPVDGGDEET